VHVNGKGKPMANEKEIPVDPLAPVNAPKIALPPGALTPQQIFDKIQTSKEELIPWEEVTLPSLGLYYGGALPDGKVYVRAMSMQDDKVFATQRLAQSGQTIDYILRHCVKLPDGFDTANMIIGDRHFLLFYLRGITYGNEYEFAVKCPDADCGASSVHKYDLNNLAQKIRRAKRELGPEPFRVLMPFMSEQFKQEVWVSVRFFRGGDITAAMNKQRNVRRVGGRVGVNELVAENIAMAIVDFMGEKKDAASIRNMVDNLHGIDSATLRQFFNDYAPGIDTIIDLECPTCGNQFRVDLPITENFFRSSGARRAGE